MAFAKVFPGGLTRRLINFTPEQDAWLCEQATETGMSISELVRHAIDNARQPHSFLGTNLEYLEDYK